MVLLADCGTTGGYPKIATVLPDDLDRMAQCRPGDAVRFETVSPEQAIGITRENSKRRNAYLQELAKPRLSLGEKLLRENLIGGMVSAREDQAKFGFKVAQSVVRVAQIVIEMVQIGYGGVRFWQFWENFRYEFSASVFLET